MQGQVSFVVRAIDVKISTCALDNCVNSRNVAVLYSNLQSLASGLYPGPLACSLLEINEERGVI